MTDSRDEIRGELHSLLEQGNSLLAPDKRRKGGKTSIGDFQARYQDWYTKAVAVIRQLMPDRVNEFEGLYRMCESSGKMGHF